jgi:ribosomal protein S18 acetylase RimI-like enzyme
MRSQNRTAPYCGAGVIGLRCANGNSLQRYSYRAMATVSVARVADASTEVLAACHRLIPQLSSSSAPITIEELRGIIGSDSSVLFSARLGADIVGLLTLVVFQIPTGTRAWIEDVVVDQSARGKGVGGALNRAALDEARRRGAKTVDLTSRPSRAAANRLYQRLGFVARETNVYRYEL